MALQQVVQQTVDGLGFDLVEIEHSAGGVLRVTIDVPWQPAAEGAKPQAERYITVDDCEVVTRQLQFALEVEGVEYKRLEVASPGIDRPLRGEADLLRFSGEIVDITLKAPLGAAAQGQVAPNRKKFRGRLSSDGAGGWQVSWSDEPAPRPGRRVSRKRVAPPLQVLGFRWDELQEARLAPIVNFKGRGKAAGAQG
ncbi:MAG: ribosome maturation factor RimP [Comamonadaceae bacterium]|nr:ribosome maturation factor RimP [Comamonadaceae bacterium]